MCVCVWLGGGLRWWKESAFKRALRHTLPGTMGSRSTFAEYECFGMLRYPFLDSLRSSQSRMVRMGLMSLNAQGTQRAYNQFGIEHIHFIILH